MIVTRHISLDNKCIRKIEPYVQKHNNNFSAAIREIIEKAGKYAPKSDTSQIDNSLLRWMLTETDGILIPDSVLSEIVNKRLMNSMSELEKFLNNRFGELGWGVDIDIKYDSNGDGVKNASGPRTQFKEVIGIGFSYKFK